MPATAAEPETGAWKGIATAEAQIEARGRSTARTEPGLEVGETAARQKCVQERQ